MPPAATNAEQVQFQDIRCHCKTKNYSKNTSSFIEKSEHLHLLNLYFHNDKLQRLICYVHEVRKDETTRSAAKLRFLILATF